MTVRTLLALERWPFLRVLHLRKRTWPLLAFFELICESLPLRLCRTTRAIMSISRAPSLTRLPALRRQESGRTQCPFRLSQMRPEPRSVCGRLTLSSNDASPPRCCGWSWRLGILGGLGRSALTDALMPVSPRKFKSSISMGLGLLYRAGLLRAMSRPTAVDCLASSVGGTRSPVPSGARSVRPRAAPPSSSALNKVLGLRRPASAATLLLRAVRPREGPFVDRSQQSFGSC